jgi:perosamine synthetase
MIPVYQPYLTENNTRFAHDAILSGWISSQGKYLDLTKNKLKELLGCKYLILTNNGTTATHLVSLSLKFKYPHIKKIIVPNNVYVAAWNSFLFDKDYEIIPIDANLSTWNMDTSNLDKLIDNETGILIVHNIGNIINVPKLKEKYPNTVFIEDNCEGFLGKYNNKYSGTESFASSLSFFGNKTLTSGEGGAFITNDEETFNYINKVKSQGQSDVKFIHDVLGYNYRMTNIQAALLYGQMEDLELILENKKNVFSQYVEHFYNVQEISFQEVEDGTIHSNWMFGIRINTFSSKKMEELKLFLYQNNIETRPMFFPITKHKHLMGLECSVKVAELLNSQCLILPSFPNLNKSQITFISEKIKTFLL